MSSSDFISILPEVKLSTLKGTDRNCSICQEAYRHPAAPPRTQTRRETPVRLPCQHVFGAACLQEWFSTNPSCPVCRKDFRAYIPDLYARLEVTDGYDILTEPWEFMLHLVQLAQEAEREGREAW